MAWSRFEPGFSRHVKRIKSGPVASWLWTCSVDFCTEFRTNGFLDDAVLAVICPSLSRKQLLKATAALLAVHSWERTEGGFMVHGYLEYNQSQEQIDADRSAGRERYQRWKNKQRRNDVANALATDSTHTLGTTPQSGSQTTQKASPAVAAPRPSRNGHRSGAAMAWSSVMDAVRAGTAEPSFRDPRIAPVLERMQGFQRVRHLNNRDVREVDIATLRKEFLELFKELSP
jgi:hypothetical protein